ncbi:low temprature induced [Pyrrhoderma noxium]|uniref:Low temprature induced n=1 Tax=Pyrrhoderma noxium TaxID=2282107 RepID=A0A286UHV8_9AGAM|nr:low temprature induced [Pyrrhoderma noxium]
MKASRVFQIMLCLIPPVPVHQLKKCHTELYICIFLTLFGYLPGLIYALYYVLKDYESSKRPRYNGRYR